MHSMKNFILFTGFILLITKVNAQYECEYDLLGKGARAAGMAYAFSAIADDATAMSWNPAGMVQVKRPEAAFVNHVTMTRRDHVLEDYNYKPDYMIDYIGFVYPFKLKRKDLVFGACFQNKMNYKYNYEGVASDWDTHNGKGNLTVNAVTLSGAFSVTRFLGIGFSYNRWFSLGNKAETSDRYQWQDSLEIDEYTSIYDYNIEHKYTGHNITAGFMLDLTPFRFPLRFAMKYESKFALKDDFDEATEYQKYYSADNLPDSIWQYEYNGYNRFYEPGIITNGISYRFGDYLTIAADLEIRIYNGKAFDWNFKENVSTYAGNQWTLPDSGKTFQDAISYEKFDVDLNHYRFGVEYILHPKFALIPVRAGWKSNRTLVFDYKAKDEPGKLVVPQSINIGTGLIRKRFSVDLAYEIYWYDRMDDDYYYERKFIHFFMLSANLYL